MNDKGQCLRSWGGGKFFELAQMNFNESDNSDNKNRRHGGRCPVGLQFTTQLDKRFNA